MERCWQLRAPDGTPITATAGCLDGHDVSLLHLPADLGRQLLAAQEIAADPARFAADDAVAAAVLAVPARVVEQLVALHPHGKLHLKGLDRGVEGIAHPDVDA